MVQILAVAVLLAVLGVPGVHAQVVSTDASRGRTGVDVTAMLEIYRRGRHDEAVAIAAALPDLGPFRLRFVQDTPRWIHADPAMIEARSAAAAAFLLELTAARLESDWGRFADLIEYTCIQLRATGPPTPFERAWHEASHALAGRARARVWLLGEYARLPHQKPTAAPPSDPQRPPARHLMHALERFPDDPHFQLSRVVAWTWGRDGEPIRNLRRPDADDRRPARRAPQLEALVALEPLTSTAAVAAEAWLRTGLVHFSVNDFASALRAFESAQPIAAEASIKYLAHFNAARSLERLSRHADAVREYRHALEVVPDAESAAIALASVQFMHDDRDAAVSLLDRVFNRSARPDDPGRLAGYGSFVRWPALKSALRQAVPR